MSPLLGAGLLLSLLAMRRLAKWSRLGLVFHQFLNVLRAMPEIVTNLAMIFDCGGGPVPTKTVIAIHTGDAHGTLFSEVAENADLKPVQGRASTGATWSLTMWLGALPQVAPNYLSYGLLRLEI